MGKAYLTAAQWWEMRKKTPMPIDHVRTSCWSLTISLKEGSGNTLESIKALCTTFTEKHREAAICFSEEEGKEKNAETGQGYRHAQMAIHIPKRITGAQMKEAWEETHAHIEPAKSQAALIKYVQKKETHVSGPYTFGAWEELCKRNANRGERTDLEAINAAIDSGMKYTEIMLDPVLSAATLSKRRYILDRIEARSCQQYGNRNRSPFNGDYRLSVDYLWGPTGTGKTASVYETYGYESVFAINDYTNAFLFDGYSGEPVLLLDEYKSNIRFKDLLTILYGNPLRLNIKGGHTYAAWTKVIICSSVPITEQYTGKLGEGDGSICQLYRRMAHGRVVHMDGHNKYPYADTKHAMMGEWDDTIGESQSITQATGINWQTGETIPGITNPEIIKHQQRYEWNND